MTTDAARALTARDILHAWEIATPQPAWARPLTVLAVATPGASWAELAALPLGARDRRLLDVHERTFGPALRGLVRCPACHDPLELTLSAASLRAAPPELGPFTLEHDGVTLRYRLVDTSDLAAASVAASLDEARACIIDRCVLDATRAGIALDPIPASSLDALQAALSERDPLAETLLRMLCPACAHTWEAFFDLASITWAAIELRGRRLLGEVHVLARAYGWTEGVILALGANRRRHYLDLVGE